MNADSQDDWCQRCKETPYDPLAEIRAEHETFLTELESLAVFAIATNDWEAFYAHVVDFQNENDLHGEALIVIEDASTKSLTRSGAGFPPTPVENEL
jgi:hypothetical protein